MNTVGEWLFGIIKRTTADANGYSAATDCRNYCKRLYALKNTV